MPEVSAQTAKSADNLLADFRGAMRCLATTVSVVTSTDDGQWHGMTATSVTSVSMEPPALLVCINSATAFHPVIDYSGRFCVNLLQTQHHKLSSAFAGKVTGQARFDFGHWRASASGLPYLMDAQANLFCEVDRRVAYGTHTLFIGRIIDVRVAPSVSPLLYQDGGYAAAAPLAT